VRLLPLPRLPRTLAFREHCFAVLHRDLMQALEALVPLNQNYCDAVDARMEIDLRIGSAFTRFQTLRLRDKFSELTRAADGKQNVLSYGPCQFPTLGFVVDRYLRRQGFMNERFWRIACTHSVKTGALACARGRPRARCVVESCL
jgi:DNA topoisomerase-3